MKKPSHENPYIELLELKLPWLFTIEHKDKLAQLKDKLPWLFAKFDNNFCEGAQRDTPWLYFGGSGHEIRKDLAENLLPELFPWLFFKENKHLLYEVKKAFPWLFAQKNTEGTLAGESHSDVINNVIDKSNNKSAYKPFLLRKGGNVYDPPEVSLPPITHPNRNIYPSVFEYSDQVILELGHRDYNVSEGVKLAGENADYLDNIYKNSTWARVYHTDKWHMSTRKQGFPINLRRGTVMLIVGCPQNNMIQGYTGDYYGEYLCDFIRGVYDDRNNMKIFKVHDGTIKEIILAIPEGNDDFIRRFLRWSRGRGFLEGVKVTYRPDLIVRNFDSRLILQFGDSKEVVAAADNIYGKFPDAIWMHGEEYKEYNNIGWAISRNTPYPFITDRSEIIIVGPRPLGYKLKGLTASFYAQEILKLLSYNDHISPLTRKSIRQLTLALPENKYFNDSLIRELRRGNFVLNSVREFPAWAADAEPANWVIDTTRSDTRPQKVSWTGGVLKIEEREINVSNEGEHKITIVRNSRITNADKNNIKEVAVLTKPGQSVEWKIQVPDIIHKKELENILEKGKEDASLDKYNYLKIDDYEQDNYKGYAWYDIKDGIYIFTRDIEQETAKKAHILNVTDERYAWFYLPADKAVLSHDLETTFWVTDLKLMKTAFTHQSVCNPALNIIHKSFSFNASSRSVNKYKSKYPDIESLSVNVPGDNKCDWETVLYNIASQGGNQKRTMSYLGADRDSFNAVTKLTACDLDRLNVPKYTITTALRSLEGRLLLEEKYISESTESPVITVQCSIVPEKNGPPNILLHAIEGLPEILWRPFKELQNQDRWFEKGEDKEKPVAELFYKRLARLFEENNIAFPFRSDKKTLTDIESVVRLGFEYDAGENARTEKLSKITPEEEDELEKLDQEPVQWFIRNQGIFIPGLRDDLNRNLLPVYVERNKKNQLCGYWTHSDVFAAAKSRIRAGRSSNKELKENPVLPVLKLWRQTWDDPSPKVFFMPRKEVINMVTEAEGVVYVSTQGGINYALDMQGNALIYSLEKEWLISDDNFYDFEQRLDELLFDKPKETGGVHSEKSLPVISFLGIVTDPFKTGNTEEMQSLTVWYNTKSRTCSIGNTNWQYLSLNPKGDTIFFTNGGNNNSAIKIYSSLSLERFTGLMKKEHDQLLLDIESPEVYLKKDSVSIAAGGARISNDGSIIFNSCKDGRAKSTDYFVCKLTNNENEEDFSESSTECGYTVSPVGASPLLIEKLKKSSDFIKSHLIELKNQYTTGKNYAVKFLPAPVIALPEKGWYHTENDVFFLLEEGILKKSLLVSADKKGENLFVSVSEANMQHLVRIPGDKNMYEPKLVSPDQIIFTGEMVMPYFDTLMLMPEASRSISSKEFSDMSVLEDIETLWVALSDKKEQKIKPSDWKNINICISPKDLDITCGKAQIYFQAEEVEKYHLRRSGNDLWITDSVENKGLCFLNVFGDDFDSKDNSIRLVYNVGSIKSVHIELHLPDLLEYYNRETQKIWDEDYYVFYPSVPLKRDFENRLSNCSYPIIFPYDAQFIVEADDSEETKLLARELHEAHIGKSTLFNIRVNYGTAYFTRKSDSCKMPVTDRSLLVLVGTGIWEDSVIQDSLDTISANRISGLLLNNKQLQSAQKGLQEMITVVGKNRTSAPGILSVLQTKIPNFRPRKFTVMQNPLT